MCLWEHGGLAGAHADGPLAHGVVRCVLCGYDAYRQRVLRPSREDLERRDRSRGEKLFGGCVKVVMGWGCFAGVPRVLCGGSGLRRMRWQMCTLKGHSDIVWSVAFSADGQRIVSGSDDRRANIWDAATGSLVSIFVGVSCWWWGCCCFARISHM